MKQAAILVAIGLLFLAPVHQRIFYSDLLKVTVINNDAPEYCSTGARGIGRWFAPRERSEVPEIGHFGYCGSIKTDYGVFKLPDDKYFWMLGQTRSSLDGLLKEGCLVEIGVRGYGSSPQFGQPVRVPLQKTIYRVLEVIKCDGQTEG